MLLLIGFEAIMSRFSFVLSLLLMVFSVSACDTAQSVFSGGRPQLVASPDRVSALLADAADRASTALETLASVEYGRSPGIAIAPADNVPSDLRRAMTINWVGPVEPITKTLADRASYGFQTVGNPPSIALVVSVDAENRPIIDILRDIGLQLGMRGDVRVDGGRRMVEMHYAPNSGVGQ